MPVVGRSRLFLSVLLAAVLVASPGLARDGGGESGGGHGGGESGGGHGGGESGGGHGGGGSDGGGSGSGSGGGEHGEGGGKSDGGGKGEGGGRGDGGGKSDGSGKSDDGKTSTDTAVEGDDGRSGSRTSDPEKGRAAPGGLAAFSAEDAAEARKALAEGRIMPLSDILALANRTAPGRVLEVELHHGFLDSWTYEVTMLGRDGRYSEILIEAREGRLIDTRRR
ncbi:PepSY domain-containing protein [Pinisolibacter sp.]|uniref:PepSY domain-containing protein n=1 Tax=Pinisolibacter sp. TaxID=2172024 RepID=UPI002FDCF067